MSGVSLEIYISENAKCTLGTGKSIYVYDLDEWGNYTDNSQPPHCPWIDTSH